MRCIYRNTAAYIGNVLPSLRSNRRIVLVGTRSPHILLVSGGVPWVCTHVDVYQQPISIRTVLQFNQAHVLVYKDCPVHLDFLYLEMQRAYLVQLLGITMHHSLCCCCFVPRWIVMITACSQNFIPAWPITMCPKCIRKHTISYAYMHREWTGQHVYVPCAMQKLCWGRL